MKPTVVHEIRAAYTNTIMDSVMRMEHELVPQKPYYSNVGHWFNSCVQKIPDTLPTKAAFN